MNDEPEVTDRLIAFWKARTEFGRGKYGKALRPFDGRKTTVDALEESCDLAQYLMKKLMEEEAVADLLKRAIDEVDSWNTRAGFVEDCEAMAARLDVDTGRAARP